jgi:hypothetical protein
MKLRTVMSVLFILCCFTLGPQLFAQSPYSVNPGIFQNFRAPVSTMQAFLASPQGQQMLLHSPSPHAKALLMRYFGSTVASQWPAKLLMTGPSGSVSPSATVTGCGTASGTRFNLEPATNPVPQNEPPVDFLPSKLTGGTANTDMVVQSANDFRGLVTATFGGLTGVYVHRDATQACYGGTDFELGSPTIADPLQAGQSLMGEGDPRVTADPSRSQFILTDLRMDEFTSAIGLRRVSATNLSNTTTCPKGTQTIAQAATCFGTAAVALGASQEDNEDFDNSTQDPRSSGTGAGDIYVTWTRFDNDFVPSTEIDLQVCTATFTTLANCSPQIVVSAAADTDVQYSWLSVVPAGTNAGKLTVVYMNYTTGTTQIKMAVCTPNGAPKAPTCAVPTVVTTLATPITSFSEEGFTIGGLSDNTFRIESMAKVANRGDGTTFIVWDTCKVQPFTASGSTFDSPCMDADVKLGVSTNLGASWTFPAAGVDIGTGTHEFFPAISVDNEQNITNIAYYKTEDTLLYKNRTRVVLKQIPAGSTTPGALILVTTSVDSPNGDPNIPLFAPQYGDYIGVSGRSTSATAGTGRAYIGHTNDSRLGTFICTFCSGATGAQNPESNNHVSKVTY